MFERMLVPLDGSTHAEQALPLAARLAHASGGTILLVQVVTPPIDYGGGWLRYHFGHQSPVPVLVLREGAPLPHTEAAHSLRALVPLDGSPLAERALVPATDFITTLAAPAYGALQQRPFRWLQCDRHLHCDEFV